MAGSQVAGIETEYGIVIEGVELSDPFLASQLLVSAYRTIGKLAVPCRSYHLTLEVDDPPLIELDNVSISSKTNSRDLPSEGEPAGKQKQDRSTYDTFDFMLSNGSRFYIDHAHPEYSTPECKSPRLLVAADKAGERILAACQHWVNNANLLPLEQQIRVFKNNSDYKSNSYGCHENYLLSTELFEGLVHYQTHKIFRYMLPFFITRIILCGAGKVGAENNTAPTGFQLSQRADFFETLIGLHTMYRRPLFNTRDEPHADPNRFRRLHVILGDANMAEFSTYLKVGPTQLVLQMLEDGFLKIDLTLENPLNALKVVSRDLTFQQTLKLEDGRQMTAVEIQRIYLDLARNYLEQKGGSEELWEVWQKWEGALCMFPNQWQRLSTRLDWAIKKHLLDRYLSAYGVTWEEVAAWQPVIERSNQSVIVKEMVTCAGLVWEDFDKQREIYFGLRRLDLEYHDIRSNANQGKIGLFYRLQNWGAIERLLTDDEIEQMITQPPPDTRSWLRGQCIDRFGSRIVSADWNRLRFYLADNKLYEELLLDLPDPLMGTKTEMEPIWDSLDSPTQVIKYCVPSSEENIQRRGNI